MSIDDYGTLTVKRGGAVLVIGLNRPDKRNAFNRAMISELAEVLGELDTDDRLRAGVLYGEGKGHRIVAGLRHCCGGEKRNVRAGRDRQGDTESCGAAEPARPARE